MAPIAARQSELCGESREITIHRTLSLWVSLYIYTYTVYTLCALVSILRACVCQCCTVTLMMMDDVVCDSEADVLADCTCGENTKHMLQYVSNQRQMVKGLIQFLFISL